MSNYNPAEATAAFQELEEHHDEKTTEAKALLDAAVEGAKGVDALEAGPATFPKGAYEFDCYATSMRLIVQNAAVTFTRSKERNAGDWLPVPGLAWDFAAKRWVGSEDDTTRYPTPGASRTKKPAVTALAEFIAAEIKPKPRA